jgi:hypothetical protein
VCRSCVHIFDASPAHGRTVFAYDNTNIAMTMTHFATKHTQRTMLTERIETAERFSVDTHTHGHVTYRIPVSGQFSEELACQE